jgi:hypothetical protein
VRPSMIGGLLSIIVMITNTSIALAKTIVVDQRFILDSSQVFGGFYKNKGKPLSFSWKAAAFGATYQCQDKEFDLDKVNDASRKFAQMLNDGVDIRTLDFLASAGFSECKPD